MVSVPSLEGSLYLEDPQSIIGYTLRKYMRTPADTVPLLSDLIISLPMQVARYGKEPDVLCSNIQSDLQSTFVRIFGGERKITVSCTFTSNTNGNYDVTISVIYTTLSGDIAQTGTTLSLSKDGKILIPEDTLETNLI